VTSLIVKNNGVQVNGTSPSDMVMAEVGDELELTCTADVGNFSEIKIRWKRTPETLSYNKFIAYKPPPNAIIEFTTNTTRDVECRYTRVSSIKYNITAADAKRSNNLAFECYTTFSIAFYSFQFISENNRRFYIDVCK
jgi:hypothetical protein